MTLKTRDQSLDVRKIQRLKISWQYPIKPEISIYHALAHPRPNTLYISTEVNHKNQSNQYTRKEIRANVPEKCKGHSVRSQLTSALKESSFWQQAQAPASWWIPWLLKIIPLFHPSPSLLIYQGSLSLILSFFFFLYSSKDIFCKNSFPKLLQHRRVIACLIKIPFIIWCNSCMSPFIWWRSFLVGYFCPGLNESLYYIRRF